MPAATGLWRFWQEARRWFTCDAAGGYVDGTTVESLRAHGLDVAEVLKTNDAYHALQTVGGLIVTGPTGTNVNDVAVALIRN